jgi:two-component system chemotaxis response regulator CheB
MAGVDGKSRKFEMILVGASTGGPNALIELFTHLSRDVRLPILVVQHMPQGYTSVLAERIAREVGRVCREAVNGETPEPGVIHIAPAGSHLVLVSENHQIKLALNQDPPVNFCRPSVDRLFESAAGHLGSSAIGVILTGIGQDGAEGCRLLALAGGHVLVQDEASSVVWGMPGSAVENGSAAVALPVPEIARTLSRLVSGR